MTKTYPNRRQAVQMLSATLALGFTGACSKAETYNDVLIVGAGLAGLSAADILQDNGVDFAIVEARPRAGGRILTLDDVPYQPDAGGMQIGAGYAQTLYLAEKNGVPLEDFPTMARKPILAIGDETISPTDWPNSPANKLSDAEKPHHPARLLGQYIDASALPDLQAWEDPSYQAQFDMPLSDWLTQQGASPTAQAYIEHTLNCDTLDGISLLNEMRKNRIAIEERHFGRAQRIVGGSSRLTEALARAHAARISYNSAVQKIDLTGSVIRVTLANGEQRSCKRLIVTLPFSVLRGIAIDPAPPTHIGGLIKTLPYAPVTCIFMEPLTDFWREDGRGTEMWSDGLVERIFSLDNRQNGELGLFFGLINGRAARAFDAHTTAEQHQLLYDEMARIRPASQGHIKIHKILSWSQQDYTQGGWSFWRPGQMSQYVPRFRQPWRNLHLAGEHMALFSFGMEAACQTGARAAFEVMDALSG